MASVGTQTAPKKPPRPSNSTKPRTNAMPSDKTPPPPPPRRTKPRGVQFKDQDSSTRAGTATEKERETKPTMASSGTQTRETGPKREREERSEGRRENRQPDREESGHHKREDSTDGKREHRRDRDSTRDGDVHDSDTDSRDRHKEESRGLFGKLFNRSGKGSDKSETDRPTSGDRSRSSRYKQPRGHGEDVSPSRRTPSEKEAAATAARDKASKVHDSVNGGATDHGTRSSRRPRETGHNRGRDSNASTRRDRDGHRGGRDESPHSTRRGHDSTARRRQSADSGAESRGVHPSHKSDKSRRVSRVLHEQYSYNLDVEFNPREFTYGEKCHCCDQEKPFLKVPVPPDVIRSLWEDGLFD